MGQRPGKRVIVIGNTNSGKSTVAERLAESRGVPYIELDALYWEPGWQASDPEVFRERVRSAIAGDEWVMAGNYSKQMDISWPKADTVVWLDVPLRTSLRRCIGRSWRRHRSQELLWGTNHERFWDHLKLWDTQQSLIAYAISSHRRHRRDREARMWNPEWAHITFIRLRSTTEVRAWLSSALAEEDCLSANEDRAA